MGMPIIVEIVGYQSESDLEAVFSYFESVDRKFSTYKNDSEITKLNKKIISNSELSEEMKEIFRLSELTTKETFGYFNIKKPDGSLDPSGIVKGWAIHKAAKILEKRGIKNFYIEAGGDIEVRGLNENNDLWKIGIRNPLKTEEVIKVLCLSNAGIATSGNYVRGSHIYNPIKPLSAPEEIISISVVGPNIYEADRFATAAFAMGKQGIYFIESLDGFEGYAIDKEGKATYTTKFNKYTI